MPKNPTIRDVAREAGVAPATASLALRNQPRLRKSICAKVQRVAAKMGYRPNPVVSQLLAQLRASRTAKAGMNQNSHRIGAAAVDMLVAKLHRNELGVPSFPKTMMIGSTWVSGDSVRGQKV